MLEDEKATRYLLEGTIMDTYLFKITNQEKTACVAEFIFVLFE